jgi:hypothetical protein
MKWSETIAATCRYSDCLEKIVGDKTIIHERSYSDYQGSVCILADTDDEIYLFYEYSYGSCSGCDTWEYAGYSDSKIVEEMRKDSAIMGKEAMIKFLAARKYDDEFLAAFKKYIREQSGNKE